MPLEFGVFQGASVGPRPWDTTEPQRIRRDIEVGIAADAAGFDTYWAPEHHCLEEYSHGSSSHLACLAVGVQTKNNRVVHDNALEFLENVLVPEFRGLLLPLIDSQVSVTYRVALANRTLGTVALTSADAVRSLLSSEDPWLRSCGAYAIGALRLSGFTRDLARLAEDADPLLREAARQAQSQVRE